ncbi:MAG: DUF5131 family protein [Alphaproteobacteria bacterium]|nr:DUF5131 family protein [Alphaproteobacteria bacterium]
MTKIEWTDETWNPIAGCSIVSKGCTNCFAMKMAARLEAMGQAKYAGLTMPSKAGPVWTGNIGVAAGRPFTQPLRWNRPRRVFVNSMSDLFHEGVSDDTIDKVFAIMALTPQHTYQVLTKRPERARAYLSVDRRRAIMAAIANLAPFAGDDALVIYTDIKLGERWPLPNGWLGVSVEDQATADERIPLLLDTPAAVRWISAEPLLGPVELTQYGSARLDWVVVGGESGPGARAMHPDWPRSLRDQCAAAGVPFLFKQHGAWLSVRDDEGQIRYGEHLVKVWGGPDKGGDDAVYRVGKHAAGRVLDGRLHDEYPR